MAKIQSYGKAIGTVSGIRGKATATGPDGKIRVLEKGDTIYEKDKVHAEGSAAVHVDLAGNGFATIGAGDSVTFDSTLLSQAADAAKAPAADINTETISTADVEALQQMIAEGKDPASVLEAAQAGQQSGGGAEEGSHFVIVEQNAARGELTPGFETATFGIPVADETRYEGEIAFAETEIPGTDTPPPSNGFDYTERMVMYVDDSNVAGDAHDMKIGAKANTGKHADASQAPATKGGYGTASIVDGKVQFELSEEGKAALEALNPGEHLVEYITYLGTDGKEHTIQVVITKENPGAFDTNADYDGLGRHDIAGETHYSHAQDGKYDVRSSAGDDIHDYKSVHDSTIITGKGADTILIDGDVRDSVISLGDTKNRVDTADKASNYLGITGELHASTVYGTGGDDRIIIGGKDAEKGVEAVQAAKDDALVHTSSIHAGEGNNDIDIIAHIKGGDIWGVYNSTITAGHGNNTIDINAHTDNGTSYGMMDSDIKTGNGSNHIHINSQSDAGPASGLTRSSITVGIGNNTITVKGESKDSDSDALFESTISAGHGTNTIILDSQSAGGTAWGMSDSSVQLGNGSGNNVSVNAESGSGKAIGLGGENGSTITVGNGSGSTVRVDADSGSGKAIGLGGEKGSTVTVGNGDGNTIDIHAHSATGMAVGLDVGSESHMGNSIDRSEANKIHVVAKADSGDAHALYGASITAGRGTYDINLEAETNGDGQISSMISFGDELKSTLTIEEAIDSNINISAKTTGNNWVSGMYGASELDINGGRNNTINISATTTGDKDAHGMYGIESDGYAKADITGDSNTITITGDASDGTVNNKAYGMFGEVNASPDKTTLSVTGNENEINIIAKAKSGDAFGMYGSAMYVTGDDNEVTITSTSATGEARGMASSRAEFKGNNNSMATHATGAAKGIGLDSGATVVIGDGNNNTVEAKGVATQTGGQAFGAWNAAIQTGTGSDNTIMLEAESAGWATGSVYNSIWTGVNDRGEVSSEGNTDLAISATTTGYGYTATGMESSSIHFGGKYTPGQANTVNITATAKNVGNAYGMDGGAWGNMIDNGASGKADATVNITASAHEAGSTAIGMRAKDASNTIRAGDITIKTDAGGFTQGIATDASAFKSSTNTIESSGDIAIEVNKAISNATDSTSYGILANSENASNPARAGKSTTSLTADGSITLDVGTSDHQDSYAFGINAIGPQAVVKLTTKGEDSNITLKSAADLHAEGLWVHDSARISLDAQKGGILIDAHAKNGNAYGIRNSGGDTMLHAWDDITIRAASDKGRQDGTEVTGINGGSKASYITSDQGKVTIHASMNDNVNDGIVTAVKVQSANDASSADNRYNKITAKEVDIQAHAISETGTKNQFAYGLHSAKNYGDAESHNKIVLTGDEKSESVIAARASHQDGSGSNWQGVTAMHAKGINAKNSITGENGSMAKGKVTIEATGDSTTGSVMGLYAAQNASNAVHARDVEVNVSGNSNTYGMYAESGSKNLIHGDTITINSGWDAGTGTQAGNSAWGFGMYTQNATQELIADKGDISINVSANGSAAGIKNFARDGESSLNTVTAKEGDINLTTRSTKSGTATGVSASGNDATNILIAEKGNIHIDSQGTGSTYGLATDTSSAQNILKAQGDVTIKAVSLEGNAEGIQTLGSEATIVTAANVTIDATGKKDAVGIRSFAKVTADNDITIKAHAIHGAAKDKLGKSSAIGVKTYGDEQTELTAGGKLTIESVLEDGKAVPYQGNNGTNDAHGIWTYDRAATWISAASVDILAASYVRSATSSEEAGTQNAYGIQSQKTGTGKTANYVTLTGDEASTFKAHVSNTSNYADNAKNAFAMHATGSGTNNIIAGGIDDHGNVTASAKHVILEAHVGEKVDGQYVGGDNGKAYGMFAEYAYYDKFDENAVNTIVADRVEMDILSGGDGYGMFATGGKDYYSDKHAINTIIASEVEIKVDAKDGAYAMYAENGGENVIRYDGDDNADHHLGGSIYADAKSHNTIETGSGNDNINIIGDILGDHTGNFYSNAISTGDGNDTVIIKGDVSGTHIDMGADNDHLYIRGDISHTRLEGGDGWDTLHLSGNHSTSQLTGKNGSKNQINGFEAIDLRDNYSDDVLNIDSILDGFGGKLEKGATGADDMQGLLDALNDSESVVMVNRDEGDQVNVDSGTWGNTRGTVDYDGNQYDVYHHDGQYLLIQQQQQTQDQVHFTP